MSTLELYRLSVANRSRSSRRELCVASRTPFPALSLPRSCGSTPSDETKEVKLYASSISRDSSSPPRRTSASRKLIADARKRLFSASSATLDSLKSMITCRTSRTRALKVSHKRCTSTGRRMIKPSGFTLHQDEFLSTKLATLGRVRAILVVVRDSQSRCDRNPSSGRTLSRTSSRLVPRALASFSAPSLAPPCRREAPARALRRVFAGVKSFAVTRRKKKRKKRR